MSVYVTLLLLGAILMPTHGQCYYQRLGVYQWSILLSDVIMVSVGHVAIRNYVDVLAYAATEGHVGLYGPA